MCLYRYENYRATSLYLCIEKQILLHVFIFINLFWLKNNMTTMTGLYFKEENK